MLGQIQFDSGTPNMEIEMIKIEQDKENDQWTYSARANFGLLPIWRNGIIGSTAKEGTEPSAGSNWNFPIIIVV